MMKLLRQKRILTATKIIFFIIYYINKKVENKLITKNIKILNSYYLAKNTLPDEVKDLEKP